MNKVFKVNDFPNLVFTPQDVLKVPFLLQINFLIFTVIESIIVELLF